MSSGVVVGEVGAVVEEGIELCAAAEYRQPRCKNEAAGRKRSPDTIAAANEAGLRALRERLLTGPYLGSAELTGLYLSKTRKLTGKLLGEMAEAEFVARASRLGFMVAKPWGDSDRFDFVVEVGGRLRRVQVKSAHRLGVDGGYSFRMHGHSAEAYREDEVDTLVAYVVPEDAWYIFPVRALGGLRSVKLYPGSQGRRSRFEKFREAWWLLGKK